jgi:hypothetical protein
MRIGKKADIIYCEGEAEEELLRSLDALVAHKTRKIIFKNLAGAGSLKQFTRSYLSISTGLKRRYLIGSEYFLIDSDLDESPEILSYIEQKSACFIAQIPNIESFLLEIRGKKKIALTGHYESDRKKCKQAFRDCFGMDAHEYIRARGEAVFTKNSIIKMRKAYQNIDKIITILEL